MGKPGEIPERTELQSYLELDMLTRDLFQVSDIFADSGVAFVGEMEQRAREALAKGEFVLFEAGCGSGACLEQSLRWLRSLFFAKAANIKAIGVDLNPLPEFIPDHVLNELVEASWLDKLIGGAFARKFVRSEPEAKFISADICNLDMPDGSVDFGYSVMTLLYVTDALKAITEGFRVLKEGGEFLWQVGEDYLSVFPSFQKILSATPGARDVFKFVPSRGGKHDGVLVCNKVPGNCFKGFDYEVAHKCVLGVVQGGVDVPRHRAFFSGAVYRAVGRPDEKLYGEFGTRRIERSFDESNVMFLQRVLKDVEAGRFPIKCRAGDSQKFRYSPEFLNARFETGDIQTLRALIRALVELLFLSENALGER